MQEETSSLCGTAYAASKIGVKQRTIINWAKAGVIQGQKRGGLWFLLRSEVDDFGDGRGEKWESTYEEARTTSALSSADIRSINRLSQVLKKKPKKPKMN